MNTFGHILSFTPAEFCEVVRPNFDTLYSVGWLDLTIKACVANTVSEVGGFQGITKSEMELSL